MTILRQEKTRVRLIVLVVAVNAEGRNSSAIIKRKVSYASDAATDYDFKLSVAFVKSIWIDGCNVVAYCH